MAISPAVADHPIIDGYAWNAPDQAKEAGFLKKYDPTFSTETENTASTTGPKAHLVEWGTGREVAVREGVCIHHLFEARVKEYGSRVAVEASDGSLTYRELEEKANRLASFLMGLGVGPESLVGVCVPRTTDMVVAVLAILKAGGAYLPLDSDLPEARLVFMLEDGGAEILVTTTALQGLFGSFGGRVLRIDGAEAAEVAAASAQRPQSGVDPSHLAYVIFTSGSTGKPKGVEVCHRAAVNFIPSMSGLLRFKADDVLFANAALFFDPSVVQMFGPLGVGAKVVVASDEERLDPQMLRGALERSGANLFSASPPILRRLVDTGWLPTRDQTISTGGEPLPLDMAQLLAANAGKLLSVYGPTEATISATGCRLQEGLDAVSIGRPLDNYQAYVVNEDGELAGIGEPGELYLGGVGLARGYRDRPELTAEKFVPDRFGTAPEGRLYRTGDRARWRSDGMLEFLGRLDTQVKIRGLRIELGEIEVRLAEHEAVRQAVVAVDGAGVGARLVAYVVLGSGRSLDLERMREFLRGFLPEYMVPSTLLEMESFPLNQRGKIDRKALPKPGRGSSAEFVPPQTETERVLARIWGELLDVENVGSNDDFFALGGHSLLATQITSRVLQSLGVNLSVRSLFETPRLSALAAHIDQSSSQDSGSGPADDVTIRRVERDGPLALSFAQKRLWFLDRMEERSDLYNLSFVIELEGSLDRDALRKSLETVVARHEVLRTRFPDEDGVPYQAIAEMSDPDAWGWVEESVTGLGGSESLTEKLERDARRPFDLAAGPLFRVGLYQEAHDRHVLQIVMHHGVADGWSMGVLGRELSALYRAYTTGRPEPLEPLPIQYSDYAVWQQEWMQGEVLDDQIGYWREQLDGVSPLGLPADRHRPAVQSFEGGEQALRLPGELTAGLRALAREKGATLYMTMMAAFHVLLHRYAGQDDIAVGMPIAGRNRPEVEGLMGMFVNTLVIRTSMEDDPSFEELLASVREISLSAHARQDLPFEKLVEELQPERDLSRNPLFQVMFAYQDAPGTGLSLPGIDARPRRVGRGIAEFDLSLSMWEEDGGMGGIWTFAEDLFDKETIEAMQSHFETLLQGIVADPSRPVSKLELVPEAERALLLDWGTGPDVAIPQGQCLHHLFEASVDRNRQRVALEAEDGALTYEELDAEANQLARYLVDIGIGPEDLVAVTLPRTTRMVVAVLGVLKAGGAYLPLDPDLPFERVAFMLEDSGAAAAVTTEDLADRFEDFDGRLVRLDGPEGLEVRSRSTERPAVPVGPKHLAYVIYTSGSTGRPKGVEVCHKNIVGYVSAIVARPGLTSEDTCVAVITLSFDASVDEIFGPLAVGGRVVLAPWETIRDGSKLRTLFEESGATFASLVPSACRILLEAGWRGEKRAKIWTGAEAMPLDLARTLSAECSEAWNTYGPTEITVGATAWRVPEEVEGIRIGKPFDNYQVYVLNPAMELTPVGVPGELFVGGVGVARGYRNRPELTTEKFVPDPFGQRRGGRLYRTGDQVRFRRDGTLEFLGRLDDQVKVRGFRIEPGEIENRLVQHPVVQRAVVVAEGAGVNARLVAYVVKQREAGTFGLPEMRSFLREVLPDYMVPSLLVELAAFPLGPSGKVDRKALPDPDSAAQTEAFVAPRTATEESLAAIWGEVLEVGRVGAHDDFFALGGHSLLATQVMSRITREMNVELSLRSLFESSTVAGLAERIDALKYVNDTNDPPSDGTVVEIEL